MSTDVLLSNNVVIFLLIESIVIFLQFIAIYYVINILTKWDFTSANTVQYGLEKQSYLATLLIYFTLYIKIFLISYFIYTIDILSNIVPGAMCGAGVISSNIYGEPLLIIKVIVVFISSLWIIINKNDLEAKNFPFLKKKFYLYGFIFIILIIEYILDILYFSDISTKSIATCCSAIYDSSIEDPLPFKMSVSVLLISFYSFYILSIFANIKANKVVSFISNIVFLYLSYYAIIYFFGTYVYELPTHHCPFCMMQSDYYYIGYAIFIFLFLGTFYGMVNFATYLIGIKENDNYYKYSTLFNTIYIMICSLYVGIYYFKNGVLL